MMQMPQLDWDFATLTHLIRQALDEDIGPGDATSLALIPESAAAQARIVAKQRLVCAGLPLAERVFRQVDPAVRFVSDCSEGRLAEAGTTLARIEGRARAILSAERTALNFLGRLCGIAALTHRFTETLAGTRAKVRDTRKTTPLLRALEKYAVRVGGGVNHRFGLYDAMLIKENHIAIAGGVREALLRAREYAGRRAEAAALPIQIEVRNEDDLREALSCGSEAVLLDNQPLEEAARLVGLAKGLCPSCVVELSGGITLENARAYAETGTDFLSSGALTHSAPAADISLLVESTSAG
jgi:nicotinate-nucleotide pyrophosphorylase (carboxylating)